ncbi:MAG: diguanylate cyclase [Sphingomonadaceae bacterium]
MDTDAKRLSHRLCLLESVLCSVNVGTIVLDSERRIVVWNSWMERHTGLPWDVVLGRDFYTVFSELQGHRVDAALQQALYNNFPSLLSQTLNKAPFPLYAQAGAPVAERLQQAVEVTPLNMPGVARHCLIQITDVSIAVTREKLLREQTMVLRSQTFSDGLTGIANRRHFDVAIEKEQRRAKRGGLALSLLMIDIDHFKAYNDHYGHQKGDQCLIQVASALASMLKRPCDLMARYGGEEFAMILPDTDVEQAMLVGEQLRRRALELDIPHERSLGELRRVTVSIGITSQPPTLAVEIDALINAADRALYRAKHNGRNRVEFLLPG